jgi:hypothetical protein
MSRSFSSFIFVLLIFILLTGCYPEPQVRPTDMDQIKIELIEKSEMPNGIAYTLKLKNLSKFTIAQNNVYISYPIKTSTGSRSNQYNSSSAHNSEAKIDF